TAPLRGGRYLALTWTYAGLAEDCARAAIVVTRLVAPPSCSDTALVLDAENLARQGAAALTMRADGSFAIATARGGARRVWHGMPTAPDGPAFRRPGPETKEPAGGGFDPENIDDDVDADPDDTDPGQ